MAATKLDIFNEAIRLFGDARLDLITDQVESRYLMDDAWKGVVEFCLRQAAWRFALVEAALITTTGPEAGYIIAYQQPGDWLRTHSLYVLAGPYDSERPIEIREKGLKLSSNAEGVRMRYVSYTFNEPDPVNRWPEDFSKIVAANLAFEVADRITNSAGAQARMAQIFGSLLPVAIAHDALPESPWLRYQLDGVFDDSLRYILTQGYWRFALDTVEFNATPITAPAPDPPPVIGYPYVYELPANHLRSHAAFVSSGDGREWPIDLREDGRRLSTTAPYVVLRYTSADLGGDPGTWPECLLETLLAYLQSKDQPEPQPREGQRGQPVQQGSAWRGVLAAALMIEGEPEDRWYCFQRSGAFIRACFHVAESGRWKFAINTVRLEADAWLNADGTIEGTLPANVYGDGSISPSYPAVFAKPNDWMRTIWGYRVDSVSSSGNAVVWWGDWPNRQDIDFRDEGGNWHARHRRIEVRYIRRAAIESWRWPQSYANALQAWLEYDESKDPTKLKLYEDAINKAESHDDSQERPPYRQVGRFVRGRFGSGHLRGEQGFGW